MIDKRKDQQAEYLQLLYEWSVTASNEAYRGLWERLYPYIQQACSKFFPAEEDQQDVASTIFVEKILPNISSYDKNKRVLFTTWVWTISQNACKDILKRRSRRDVSLVEEMGLESLKPQFLDVDELAYITGFTLFRLSNDCLQEVANAFICRRGNSDVEAVDLVASILDDHVTDWREYGTPYDITAFLFALIRMAKVEESDRIKLVKYMSRIAPSSPAGLLQHYFSPEQMSLLVLLFGGSNLVLPSASKLVPRRRSRRAKRSRAPGHKPTHPAK